MDTLEKARLALKVSADRHTLDGAWWPRSHVLSEELVALFAAWPDDAGYISRVVVSPQDWDSTPAAIEIPRRRGLVKIALLPMASTHQMVLIMLDGQRRALMVIPPDASEKTAAHFFGAFGMRYVPAPTSAPAGPAQT